MSERILVEPSYSITPSKVCSFNSVYFLQESSDTEGSFYSRSRPGVSDKSRNTRHPRVVKQFHNFKISNNARRNLNRKINWLYYLSRKRQITTYTGKKIFNFRCCFLTLTLPSKQAHCTKDITNEILNPFLTDLRKRLKMVNYVWRLEFQKNGNVHYHLVTDTYIDYLFARKLWNHHLNKFGYIAPYSEKYKKMTLSQYHKVHGGSYNNNFKISAVRYKKGCESNWSQPNSVDVKSVVGEKNIAHYISKYFSKDSDGDSICNGLDNVENSKSMRLWFCSRSLSKLQSISGIVGDMAINIIDVAKSLPNVRKVFKKYCTIYYLDFKKMSTFYRSVFDKILRQYAYDTGYYNTT